MMSDLVPIFGSKTKAQEILLLLHRAKEVVRQGFYAEELPLVEQFCAEKKIHVIKSRFKVLLTGDLFSDKGIRIHEHDAQRGMFFVYFSQDEEKAYLASYYELTGKQQELGLLLGYPACCVDFFCSNFNENKSNLEWPAENPWTNLSLRIKDCVLLAHFPCHSACPESIALAKYYFSVIQQSDQEYANELQKKLGLPLNGFS